MSNKKTVISNMLLASVVFVAALFMMTSLPTYAAAKKQEAQSLDSIIAVVNDGVITESQLNLQTKLAKKQLTAAHMKVPAQAVLKKQILDRLIDAELQLQVAKKHGIEVTNQQLNQAVARVAAENHLSVADFRKAVVKQGLTYPEYRKQMRDELKISQLQQRVLGKKVNITSQEVNDFLKTMDKDKQKMPEFHLKGILIALPVGPTPEQIKQARERAEAIITKLHKGADFSTTAVAESAGKFALKGGDMGWRQAAELPPQLTEKLEQTKTGKIVGPIQSPNGFYILKVLDKRVVPMQHFVTETHVRNILLKPNELTPGKVFQGKLEKIRQDILNGAQFATIAKKYSQDSKSASKGGDMGWIATAQVPASFAMEMNKLKEGYISQPFYTQYGWQIIQVLDRRKVDDTKRFLKNQVTQLIYRRKLQQAVQNWLQELRGDSYVKVFNSATA